VKTIITTSHKIYTAWP